MMTINMKINLKIVALFALLLVLSLGMSLPCVAEEKAPATTDFINLAAIMIKDGHYDRALLALQSVDLEDEKTDLARFYTLQGLAYLSLDDLLLAKESLQKAVVNGQQDKVIYVYLAQAYYGLKEYRKTVEAIAKASDAAKAYPALVEMQAQSYWELKQPGKAIKALNEGIVQFPDDYRFLRRKVFYLVELQLYQSAAELGRIYLTHSNAQAKDYVAIGNALRLNREYQQALSILEPARLQFPGDTTIAKLLAYTYLDQGDVNAAAFIMEQAARNDPELLSEAVELYRRAGRYYKSLSLNAGISDQKIKLKQRMAILLALKRYELAANMEPVLYRVGLLDDQNIRYALAYALFSVGRYQTAEKHLDHLQEPDLFKKGIELRRLMNECREEVWKCTL